MESLSIADLIEFVNSASSQEIDFICTEKVTGIKLDKGWCYVSCSNSTKKLQRTVSAFTCLDCNNTNAVGVLKTDVSGGDVQSPLQMKLLKASLFVLMGL